MSLSQVFESCSDFAVSLLNDLAQIFNLIVFENGTLGDFLDLAFAGTGIEGFVSVIADILNVVAPFPIGYVIVTGLLFWIGVTIVRWFIGIVTGG